MAERTPRQPTNRDIMNELKSVSGTLANHDRDIKMLMNWKIAVEAVDRYQARQNQSRSITKADKPIDWTKIIITTLGLTAAAIGVIGVLASRG